MNGSQGKQRVVIENVKPQLNCGQYPVKRVVGEPVVVTADVFADGHDDVRAALLYRNTSKRGWIEVPMQFLGNDRWQATFLPDAIGTYEYTVKGWVDHYSTWQKGFKKKHEAGQDVAVEIQIGATHIAAAATATKAAQKKKLQQIADRLNNGIAVEDAVALASDPELNDILYTTGRDNETRYEKVLQVQVERQKALFSSWYEFFPRSTAAEPGKHGTFKDCEKILPRIAEMGFDVIYLPPIHPIGKAFRKGKNNNVKSQPGEPGSPWAIGAAEGGHKDIHPELGTLEEFRSFVQKAEENGIEVALDFAIQCSPDHPYVKEHPEWFKWRPDGTVQYAENPPKKYQDVLPVNFETEDWRNLWRELKSILDHWIDQGVNIFRVDNPHTKTFGFWEWCIAEIHKKHPQVIFLAEAFTRPRVMERLAKIGFTQSYTYFTWRHTVEEFRQYLTELTRTDMREYFRPNFWPNTPDINPPVLQTGGEAAHIARVVMAGTMSSNFGLYGPVYEFGIADPVPGKEEYLDSEKYEIKNWEWNRRTKIREVITQLNKIRRENAALQTTWNISVGNADNQQLLCYAKWNDDRSNRLIMVVNLDPHHTQGGWVQVPLRDLRISDQQQYTVHDLFTGHRYTWQGEWNFVELRPHEMPVHVFRIEEVVSISINDGSTGTSAESDGWLSSEHD
jgi:starch synthase (maltosyl-transferring)